MVRRIENWTGDELASSMRKCSHLLRHIDGEDYISIPTSHFSEAVRRLKSFDGPTVLINKQQAASYVGWSVVHLMREAVAGRFPRPVKLSRSAKSSVRFVKSEVEAWIEERVARRNET